MQNGGLRIRGIIKTSTPEQPLITVVTVVFNGEATLEQTIQSVVNQTYDNVEYIVVDGNSTDRTLDIIKKYEDRIDYWQSEPDKGIYDAMNKAIDLATGDWLNFMNVGDTFYSNKVLSKIFGNGEIPYDVIYGNSFCNGNEIKPKSLLKIPIRMPFCHQASFVRKSCFDMYKFDLSYKLIADGVFFYRIKKSRKFNYINEVICKYDGSGVSSNQVKVYEERKQFLLAEHKYILLFIWKLYLQMFKK